MKDRAFQYLEQIKVNPHASLFSAQKFFDDVYTSDTVRFVSLQVRNFSLSLSKRIHLLFLRVYHAPSIQFAEIICGFADARGGPAAVRLSGLEHAASHAGDAATVVAQQRRQDGDLLHPQQAGSDLRDCVPV